MNNINLSLALVILACFSSVYGLEWRSIPGSLKHVSTSINYLWGVNKNDQIYRCTKPCSGGWIRVAGALKQVDVGEMEVWGVNSADYIYKRAADGSGSWVKVGGRLKHVSASGNGYIWGVNKQDNIYSCKMPCSGKWTRIAGKLKQIDGGDEFVFGVNSANNVYRRPVDGSGRWTFIPNKKMKYVTVGSQKVYGLNAKSEVFSCELPCDKGNWEDGLFCLALDQIDASISGDVVGTGGGAIYEGDLP